MRYSLLAVAAAIVAVSASDDCQAKYTDCKNAGTPEVACNCDLTACVGEDNARNREYCASATANLTSASATSTGAIITGTPGSQPSGQPPITAAVGSLPLGQTCSDTKQCANGAQCWGSTAGTIRACGNFNAACTRDSECAYNTCNNGLCNGFLASSLYPANSVSSTAAPTSTGYACNPAHEYPEGRKCISTNGGLTLLPPTTTSGPQSSGYACNPAHQYPAGQVCTEINGSLILVTGGSPAPTAATTPLICNAAAIARGDCSATAAIVPTYGAGNATQGVVAATGTGAVGPSGTGVVPYTGAAGVAFPEAFAGLAAAIAGAVAFVL